MSAAFHRFGFWGQGAAAALIVALCACGNIVQSDHYDLKTAAPGSVACNSALGSYVLPKTFLKVQVGQLRDGNTIQENVLSSVSTIIRGDEHAYCLDFLGSVVADDHVVVKKTAPDGAAFGNQFLQVVASAHVDETPLIIQRLAKIVVNAIAARSLKDTDAAKYEATGDFEFDPFDQDAAARVNRILVKYGFCLVLEDYTFDKIADDGTANDPQKYCSAPSTSRGKAVDFAHLYAAYNSRVPVSFEGIFFRKRAPYQLRVYAKTDPGGREPWLLRQTQTFYFENISPVYSIQLDRAAFTTKKIALLFDSGALRTACIYKDSELVGFAGIPLKIVNMLVALPTLMAQLQLDNINSDTDLTAATQAVLNAQRNELDLLNSQGATGTKPAAHTTLTALPSATFGVVPAATPSASFPASWTTDCGAAK